MNILIGLDPGGKHRFGWCIAEDVERSPLRVLTSGLADDAASAVKALLRAMPENSHPVAAGIDSPLFWSRLGSRRADALVRDAIRKAGARYSAGTVQSVNSLKGACLAQGLLAAMLLRERYPALPITEAHPKALLWLLPTLEIPSAPSEHERDAQLAAVAAWAMFHNVADWRDLYPLEPQPYSPVSSPLHYFMPEVVPDGALEPAPVHAEV